MDINEYQNGVIKHFKSGRVTEEEWQIIAKAMLDASESSNRETKLVDDKVVKIVGKPVRA